MDDGTEELLEELQDLCYETTEDSVSDDLARARSLASVVPEDRREEALSYVRTLQRLERWLHDR